MNKAISFRDPGGKVLCCGDRVLRAVNGSLAKEVQQFLSSELAAHLCGDGLVAGSVVLDQTPERDLLPETFLHGAELLLEHEKVFFPSYPNEWAPEMLEAAALLTVELAERLLASGMGLKDATPYNVLFEGTRPIFVDILSFEKRDPEVFIWLPLAQFERTFLLPLLVNYHFGMKLDQIFLSRREGITPEQVYGMCGPLKRVTPTFLMTVTLPVWLSNLHANKSEAMYVLKKVDAAKCSFILKHTFKRLRKVLKKTTPRRGKAVSGWSEYDGANPESGDYCQAKSTFIENVMTEYAPQTVLDVGCNTGRYSIIASRRGAKVVSMDSDSVVIGRLWAAARRERLDVLPLVVDFSNPSPSTGWCNGETFSFLDRARGRFEAVFMLAVVHHLLVTERVPLGEIVSVAGQITKDLLVIEYVGPTDPMFRVLCRGRDDLFEWYGKDAFESAILPQFQTLRFERLGESERWLYLLRKRT